jgi:hypothetical protein
MTLEYMGDDFPATLHNQHCQITDNYTDVSSEFELMEDFQFLAQYITPNTCHQRQIVLFFLN